MMIWIVESEPSRQGPYVSSDPHVREARRLLDFDVTPTPCNDSLLSPHWSKLTKGQKEWYFGFSSLAQFKQWFHSVLIRQKLAQGGMKLCKYSVPSNEVRLGNTPLCFRRSVSKLIETRPPDY